MPIVVFLHDPPSFRLPGATGGLPTSAESRVAAGATNAKSDNGCHWRLASASIWRGRTQTGEEHWQHASATRSRARCQPHSQGLHPSPPHPTPLGILCCQARSALQFLTAKRLHSEAQGARRSRGGRGRRAPWVRFPTTVRRRRSTRWSAVESSCITPSA